MTTFQACDCCAKCFQLSASGFSLPGDCAILTDITENADAVGDWPQFPTDPCADGEFEYQLSAYDSAFVLHQFSATLQMPGVNGGLMTLDVSIIVGGETVWSATYEKNMETCLLEEGQTVSVCGDDITDETGGPCGPGCFTVSPCGCKCQKLGAPFVKSLFAYGIFNGRFGSCGAKWVAEVGANGAWTQNWVCVDVGQCLDLAIGDVVWREDVRTPEASGVPSLPVASCACGDGRAIGSCAWAAIVEEDSLGNLVPVPFLQPNSNTCDGPQLTPSGINCDENPLP